MKKINLKEVARTIVEKQPYKIIKDEETKEAATELTQFVDVLTFSVYRVGRDFRNIPYDLHENQFITEKKHIGLIGIDGEVIETINCSKYSSTKNSDELKKERKNFRFTSNEDTLIFALKLTEDNSKTGIRNYLLFLSKPMTIGEIQAKRDSYYESETNTRIEKNLAAIEFIWK